MNYSKSGQVFLGEDYNIPFSETKKSSDKK